MRSKKGREDVDALKLIREKLKREFDVKVKSSTLKETSI